jgi:hypothetical protein
MPVNDRSMSTSTGEERWLLTLDIIDSIVARCVRQPEQPYTRAPERYRRYVIPMGGLRVVMLCDERREFRAKPHVSPLTLNHAQLVVLECFLANGLLQNLFFL